MSAKKGATVSVGRLQTCGGNLAMTYYMMCYIPAVRSRSVGKVQGFAVDIPDLIKRIRAACNLTQEALARQVDVTFSTVNGWENGRHRPIPSLIGKLVTIAKAAGLAVTVRSSIARPRVRRQ